MKKKNEQQLILTKGGKTDYTIVIANDATEQEYHAGEELAIFLKKVTGAEFPVQREIGTGKIQKKPQIFVGYNSCVQNIIPGINLDDLGKEGFVIITKDSNLIIIGGRPRGTLYGVYTFLEDYVGCRWYSSKVSKIPQCPDLIIDPISVKKVPYLEYRHVFYYDSFDADWAVRNKSNGGYLSKLDYKRGGKITFRKRFGHTLYYLVPPGKYFQRHPEYFSEINGKRVWETTGLRETRDEEGYFEKSGENLGQLCLTNIDLVKVVAENAKVWLREPNDDNIIDISQMDNYNRCQCKECLKLEEEEGGPSGPLIHFVNKVAELIEQEFPEIFVSTFAYAYTRKPPIKVRPRNNVLIQLCNIECSFLHPLTDIQNKDFFDDFIAWSKLTDNIYIWDYVTNFDHYLQPHPNLYVLAPNIKLFVENGVKGIFEEGAHNSTGEFAELRAWLIAKLLWNPYLDIEILIKDFLKGYYEEAGPFILKYIKLIHDKAMKFGKHIGAVRDVGALRPNPIHPFLDDPITIIRAIELFNSAEKAVNHDPELLSRVQLARLPVDYVNLVLWTSLKQAAKKHNLSYPYERKNDWLVLYKHFFKVIKQWKITMISEFTTIKEFHSQKPMSLYFWAHDLPVVQ